MSQSWFVFEGLEEVGPVMPLSECLPKIELEADETGGASSSADPVLTAEASGPMRPWFFLMKTSFQSYEG